MIKILVVDDMDQQVRLLTKMFKKIGYAVAGSAASGAEAVETALSMKPDIILMDIVMPGEPDGIEAARRIREQSDIPIVFTTSHSSEDYLQRALEITPYAYLIKPISEDQLRVTIKTIHARIELKSKLAKAAAALRKSEKQYRNLVNNSPVGMFRVTPGLDGRFLFANPALLSMHNFQSMDEIKDLPIADVFSDRNEFTSFLQKVQKGESANKERICFKRRYGAIFWGLVTAYPISDDQGNLKYYEGLVEDITEEKAMQAELNAVYSDMSSQVEIEERLQNALDALSIAQEDLSRAHGFMRDELLPELESRAGAQRLAANARALVEQLSIAVTPLDRQPIPVTDIATEAVNAVRGAAAAAGVDIAVEPGDLSLFGDKALLVRAMEEILRAAIALFPDASAGGRNIRINAESNVHGDVCSVQLSGVVIPEIEHKDLLTGTGSFSMAGHIIARHNGLLWIDAREDNDSAVCFTLS